MHTDQWERFEISPYWRLLGIKVSEAKPGFARLVMPVKEDLLQIYSQVHGGAIASLIDCAVAAALTGLLSPDEKGTTVEMKVNYLHPATKGILEAEARIIKKGRTLAVGEVEVRDADETIIAVGIATYMVLKGPQDDPRTAR